MIALVDYGLGNLRSVEKALTAAGAQVCLTSDPEVILSAEKVVLPGVGAFGQGMAGLRERGLGVAIQEVITRGSPLLGICLGMQMLFERSEEGGECAGLGALPGCVKRFNAPGFKIPQTGWNQIWPTCESALLCGLAPGAYVYFNHGFFCEANDADTLARTDYGLNYASVVGRGRVYGVQFHPEKSQQVGLTILRNFVQHV